ncbi:MAG: membrane protein insertase YidC [Lachnospiraceae bacterium]|nr:membrane protein insertase YidC [Lachnospiraceae bacterium]
MYRVLTKSSTPIIGWIAILLGFLMNGIFIVLGNIGIPNVGIAIILFTIILLMAMMPLQIKQQRFSKLNAIMAPELQRVQAKYKGKKDSVSQQKQMDETQAVYAKYGVSPTGSCVQLLIQMPVLFALYQVIYRIPGYITVIGNRISEVTTQSGFAESLTSFVSGLGDATLTNTLGDGSANQLIDTVYKMNTTQWSSFLEYSKEASYFTQLNSLHDYITRVTSFLTLNITDTPLVILRNAWTNKQFIMIVCAILIPALAWFTQWLNIRMMPQAATGDANDAMSQSMKSMNNFMPIMSAVFCFTLPTGVGIYWITSAVVRALQQFFINRHLDKESPDEIVRKAQEKANKKRAKQGLPPQKITGAAHVSTRTLEADRKAQEEAASIKNEQNKKRVQDSTSYYNQNAKPGSIASKANMVKQFDEKKSKKK